MRKILLASVGLILIFAALLLACGLSRPVGLTRLTVSFLASGKDPSGTPCCYFVLSNSGPNSIYRISSYRITGLAGRDQDTITNGPLGFDYQDRVLRPEDSEIITVPTPVGETAWRARFDYWTYKGPIGSDAENFVMWARSKIGMKITDVHHWGTGMSEIVNE